MPANALAKGGYKSTVQTVAPPVSGLTLTVINRDERLKLDNRSGRTVIVEGYDGEPYLRFSPDGKVENNTRSAATYLNEDRYGTQPVPNNAVPSAKPRWKAIGSGGTYTWFDHRIHLTNKKEPAEVRGKKKPTRIFGWKLPLSVDSRPVTASGALYWEPDTSSSGGIPVAPVVAGVAGALVLAAISLMVLRRRRGAGVSGAPEQDRPAREAW
jgi:hypothetical protein